MSTDEIALYYPYIDITDPALIKTAALYWDKIQTIVPRSIDNPFNRACSREAYKENFLEERYVDPHDEAVESAGLEFIEDINNEPIQKHLIKRLRPPFSYRNKSTYSGGPLPTHLKKFSPIFMDKISSMLRRELELTSENKSFNKKGVHNIIVEVHNPTNGDALITEIKIGGSRFFELGWAWKTRVFKESNWLRLKYGFSFSCFS